MLYTSPVSFVADLPRIRSAPVLILILIVAKVQEKAAREYGGIVGISPSEELVAVLAGQDQLAETSKCQGSRLLRTGLNRPVI
jgi:hypothetical protein